MHGQGRSFTLPLPPFIPPLLTIHLPCCYAKCGKLSFFFVPLFVLDECVALPLPRSPMVLFMILACVSFRGTGKGSICHLLRHQPVV